MHTGKIGKGALAVRSPRLAQLLTACQWVALDSVPMASSLFTLRPFLLLSASGTLGSNRQVDTDAALARKCHELVRDVEVLDTHAMRLVERDLIG